ncbi:MAG: hypothetical protein M0Q45_11825 [Bacteroidales bacterium]|nr:hypothetical protein [Bacteroidales bacterium]MCK9500178.1 hypothetical protein [Bacteroidales bacterium]
MKKNIIITIFLTFTLLIVSCKPQKNIIKNEVKTEVDSTVKNDIIVEKLIDSAKNTTQNTIISSIKHDFSEKEIFIKEYSTPDSLGNQFLQKEIKILTNNRITEKSDKNKVIKDSIKVQHQDKSIDKTKIDFSQKTHEKTKEKTINNTAIIISALVLVFLGLMVWRFFLR